MKKIVLLLIGLIILPTTVAAYQVNIEAPETLTVGKPLVVTGTTTFGIGTPIDVVLYYQLTTTTELQRKIVYIQPDKTFKAVFDTTGLKTGIYKVEVPTSGMGSDAVTMRVVELIDRSDAIHISSPLTQSFTGKLQVAGSITGGENSGIQIEVIGPDNGVVFGPRYVNTNYLGDFSVEVPVNEVGDYEVSFTDSKGYIGARSFTILAISPISGTPAADPGPVIQLVSAHAFAKKDQPAYFIVEPGTGPVTIYTSSSLDWVVEYFDENGFKHTINDKGLYEAERVSLVGKEKTLFFAVYPKKPDVSGEAVLYGQNVKSVIVSPEAPEDFAAAVPEPGMTQESPVSPIFAIIAACLAIIAIRQ